MDTLDIVMAIESGQLLVDTMEKLQQVKDTCKIFANSQGFYGRLLENLDEITEQDLPIML